MQNTLTIARRQFLSYFNGPVAYIVGALFLLFAGMAIWVFPFPIFIQGRATVRELFSALGLLTVFVAPALTMGLIAEERRTGTLELLMTMPVKDSEVIVGKFLAALGLYSAFILLTLVQPLSVSTLGNLDWGPVIAGYVGLLLYGAAMLSVGMFFSAVTESQLLALFVGMIVCLALWAVDWLGILLPGWGASLVELLSLDFHLKNIERGIIDSRDIIYFATIIFVALGLAFRALESRRWR